MEKENSNINYKSNKNQNSLIRKNSYKKTTIRQNKKKRSSYIIDSSTPSLNKRFESLINIHDDSFIYKSDENKHNTTYTLNPKVKKLLLKGYKQDIKKENILIDDLGHIKLIDFSKSKILSFEGDFIANISSKYKFVL